jgi:hypothetical protein
MNIQYELQEPFKYSWGLAKILIVVTIILLVAYIVILLSPRFYDKYLSKLFRKSRVPSLKVRYVRKLENLLNMVNSNRIINKEAYTILSLYIREFVKKATGINVLSSSKEEIKKLGMPDLSRLMEEYYPPEFAKYANGNIIGSIERSIEVIKRWN